MYSDNADSGGPWKNLAKHGARVPVIRKIPCMLTQG